MKKVLYEKVRHIRYLSEITLEYTFSNWEDYPKYHTTYEDAQARIEKAIEYEINPEAQSYIAKFSIKIEESLFKDFRTSSLLTLYEARIESQDSK